MKSPLGNTTPVLIRIPDTLMIEVRLLLMDPAIGRVQHGALSRLIEQLLSNWLSQHKVHPHHGRT